MIYLIIVSSRVLKFNIFNGGTVNLFIYLYLELDLWGTRGGTISFKIRTCFETK